MMTELSEMSEKIRKNFSCELCDYITCDKKDYNKHCSTRKHKMMTNDDPKNNNGEPTHICSQCNKQYKTKQSLWVHKKKCVVENRHCITQPSSSGDLRSPTELVVGGVNAPLPEPLSNMHMTDPMQKYIMQLVEQNVELKNMFIKKGEDDNIKINELSQLITEQSKQIVIHNNTTNNNNNKTIHNTQFNLNVFLQETCKDAINMSDFINSLKIDAASLHHTGTHGYVNGISKIFTDGLQKLKVHERPIHCTDLKREVLYIKDNDKWEKDTKDNKQFKKVLGIVVYRNMIQIQKWEEENPRCRIQETDDYEFYFEVIRQSLGGGNHDVTARNNDKILKAIAQEVHIDKKQTTMRTL